MSRTRSLITAIGLLATASAADAQLFPARDTTPVPRDLAVALLTLNSWGDPEPNIVVGRLPDSSIAPLVPPRARILGGISRGRRDMEGADVAIVEVRETPDSILNVIEAAFERLGWKKPAAMEMEERGGFVTSQNFMAVSFTVDSDMDGLAFCSDSAFVSVSAAPAGNRSIVRYAVGHREMGRCADSSGYRHPFAQLEMPTLRPPQGAGATTSGMGGGMGSREMTATISWRLSAAEMIRHFVPQLEEQGWTVATLVNQADISAVTGTKATEKGDSLRVMLTDYKYDARNHHASLRVWNPAARGW